jgi:hypothetical protein
MFNPNQAFLLVQKLKSALKGFTLGVKVPSPQLGNAHSTHWAVPFAP